MEYQKENSTSIWEQSLVEMQGKTAYKSCGRALPWTLGIAEALVHLDH